MRRDRGVPRRRREFLTNRLALAVVDRSPRVRLHECIGYLDKEIGEQIVIPILIADRFHRVGVPPTPEGDTNQLAGTIESVGGPCCLADRAIELRPRIEIIGYVRHAIGYSPRRRSTERSCPARAGRPSADPVPQPSRPDPRACRYGP